MPKGLSLRDEPAGKTTMPVTAPIARISPPEWDREELLLATTLSPRLCVLRDSEERAVAARWMFSSERLRTRVVMAQTKLISYGYQTFACIENQE